MKKRFYFLNGKGGGQSFPGFPLTLTFHNPDVSLEEERFQAEFWKRMQRNSESRSRKLILEWKQEMNPVKPKNEITPFMVERAKEYPVENLLFVVKGLTKCISGEHEDKRPSMNVRNNKVRCFACGFHGDSIDVAMRINGWSFHEAVKNLQ